jgi:putative CocE/NonD family hydrolase
VALTVGPWTHIETVTKGGGMINTETLDWLDTHLTGAAPARKQPVRVYRTGAKTWHELPEWPPATLPVTYRPQPDGALVPDDAFAGDSADKSTDTTSSFVYDPRNPTPSVGGRTLSGSMGIKDQRDLEARPDVLTFTSPPLTTALDITGSPTVELAVEVDNPYADVFVRLCDVDERGRSHNVSDVLLRLDPTIAAGTEQHLTLELDACFHRLLPGRRVRLQISGGSFPRFARNLGTDGTPADGNVLKPATHTVHLARTRITLPSDAASTTP